MDPEDDLIGTPPKSSGKDIPRSNGGVAAEELRQFIERYERLEEDKKAIATDQKELMAEAKGRGYCVKSMRKIIAERKRNPDDLAEEEAILEIYRHALGMG